MTAYFLPILSAIMPAGIALKPVNNVLMAITLPMNPSSNPRLLKYIPWSTLVKADITR